jgi:hypothetical protein
MGPAGHTALRFPDHATQSPSVTIGAVWLTAIGTTLQLAGLGLAAYGVRVTRLEYAPERPGAVGAVYTWTVRHWDWLRAWLGHPRPGRDVHAQDVGTAFEFAAAAHGEVVHGDFPDTMTLAERVDALDKRTRMQRKELNELQRAMRDEREQKRTDVNRLTQAVTTEREQRRTAIAGAMVDGLNLESWGLFLAFLGTAVAACGN